MLRFIDAVNQNIDRLQVFEVCTLIRDIFDEQPAKLRLGDDSFLLSKLFQVVYNPCRVGANGEGILNKLAVNTPE
jgi:hypothetical protein